MTKKTEACSSCNAEYSVSYKLDKDYYRPIYCPFCSEQIAEDCVDDEQESEE